MLMLFTYFSAAALGVFVATLVAGMMKSSDIRRQMRQQLLLQTDTPSQPEEYAQTQQPAAMVSSSF